MVLTVITQKTMEWNWSSSYVTGGKIELGMTKFGDFEHGNNHNIQNVSVLYVLSSYHFKSNQHKESKSSQFSQCGNSE